MIYDKHVCNSLGYKRTCDQISNHAYRTDGLAPSVEPPVGYEWLAVAEGLFILVGLDSP